MVFGTGWSGLKQGAAVWLLVLGDPGRAAKSNLCDSKEERTTEVML